MQKDVAELPESLKKLAEAEAKQLSDEKFATENGITVERLDMMRRYAKELVRKNPKMRPERVNRKVAEHFNVKLKNGLQ